MLNSSLEIIDIFLYCKIPYAKYSVIVFKGQMMHTNATSFPFWANKATKRAAFDGNLNKKDTKN